MIAMEYIGKPVNLYQADGFEPRSRLEDLGSTFPACEGHKESESSETSSVRGAMIHWLKNVCFVVRLYVLYTVYTF